jgi:hypothetical protein
MTKSAQYTICRPGGIELLVTLLHVDTHAKLCSVFDRLQE